MTEENAPERKVDLLHTIRAFAQLVRPYSAIFFALIGIVLVVESSYVFEKYLFKLLVDNGTTYAAGALPIEMLYDALLVIVAVYGVTLLIRVLGKWVHQHIINRLDANLIRDLKRRFFDHIVDLSHRFHTTHKTGSLISRLTRGGSAVESMMDVVVFNVAPLVLQFLVVAVSLWYVDRIPSLVVACTVLAFVGYSLIIVRRQLPASQAANDAEDAEKAITADVFTNIESIKYFGKERLIKQRYDKISGHTKAALLRRWDYFRWIDAGQSLIIGIGTALLIFFPLRSFLAGTSTLGDLTFIYTVYMSLLAPMFGFIHGVRSFYSASANFDSLYEYAEHTNEIKDLPGAIDLHVERGEIIFDDISFTYHQNRVLDHVTIRIAPKEKVAIVGHSGSGKSTIVKLLYRFYDVDAGHIRIDGTDVRNVRQETLRSEMSIVPQDCILFDDTIYENVRFSRPDATSEEVLRAIRFAQLDKVVAKMPKGEQTIVGERGVRLSGGEKQRVSIARALLADKRILVLDEATSALDSKTEHEIQQDLFRLMEGRTAIIIAHRLSTIMRADRVIVLENGRIIQSGTHKQLIKRKGRYRELWDLQKGGYLE